MNSWVHGFRSVTMFCGQFGPNAVASRAPDHEGTGAGGAQRSGPVGGAAYRMPRNTDTSAARPRLPASAPLRVLTVGPSDALSSDVDTSTTRSVNKRLTVFSYFNVPR